MSCLSPRLRTDLSCGSDRLGTAAMRPIQETEGASFPFWSPDSRFIGFFAGGKLKKVPLTGGPPIVLCDASSGRGGTWNANNVIVFAPSNTGVLQRVSGAGGSPAPLLTLDESYGEINHRFPSFPPDGDHFFYTAVTGAATIAPKPSRIKIGTLSSPESTLRMDTESSAAYSSGHVFFLRSGTLMAEPFDPICRRVTGDPFPVADRISTEGSRYAAFAISSNGVLVYAHGEGLFGNRLTWRNRAGKVLGEVGDAAFYSSVALSPDEHRAAVTVVAASSSSNARDVWIVDIDRNLSSKLTFDPGDEAYPVWSPDGARVAFSVVRANERGIYTKSANGTGTEEAFVTFSEANPINASFGTLTDWSHDGRVMAYATATAGLTDIWIIPTSGDRKAFAFAATPFNETHAVFSQDSRWIAYTSYESGRPQVFVQPFPPTGVKEQISRDGGAQPMWRGDGRELFFLTPDGTMMATTITTTPDHIDAAAPQPLFVSNVTNVPNPRLYAVTKDGQRFLINARPQQSSSVPPLAVVVNWTAGIQK
jgi:hypothetical protein